jgi:uncharacterized RDD family membrane protein YckC
VDTGLVTITSPAAAGAAQAELAQAKIALDQGETRFLTGEAVHLDVRVARVGSRVLARLIDILIQVVLYLALVTVLSLLATLLGAVGIVALDGSVLEIITIVALVIALIGYPVLMETTTRGRTLGKLVVGLRVVRDDGGPVTFRQALTRGLVGVAIEWPGIIGAPLTWLVTIWAMIANPQSKRIGDHVAGTIVIHERTPAAWGWVPQMPPGMANWAATLDLTGLDDDLALAIRHFLARNRRLREPARTALGLRLAQEVAAVTNPPPPPGTPGWAYLAAVHAERHQRAMRQLAAVRSRAAAVWPELTLAATHGASPLAVPAGLPGRPPAGLPAVPPPAAPTGLRPAAPGPF